MSYEMKALVYGEKWHVSGRGRGRGGGNRG